METILHRKSTQFRTCWSVRWLVIQLLLIFGFTTPVFAWQTLSTNLDLECFQSERSRLDCEYRLLIPEPPLDIRAESSSGELTVSDERTYPWPGGRTAILFVVDTSDPARQIVLENNQKHIESLLELRLPHHDMGLVSFDKDLRIEAPIGSSNASILSALQSVNAIGRTTEMYRNMLKAIILLENIQADRKAIFLLSDGQAEDKAYFHNDVVRQARKAGVVINGLGYPRSVPLSVALQTLRRLSEETGGIYIESDDQYNLPRTFLNAPYENIENGGAFSIALSTESGEAIGGSSVSIIFETDIGDITAEVPILPPRTSPAATTAPAPSVPAQTSSPAPEIRYVPQQQPQEEINLWLWYGIPIGLALIIIIAVITLVVVFLRNDSRTSVYSNTGQTEYKPYAYLVVQDEKATRYPVTNTTWRIGRTKDNELTLMDSSVSRRHAEIHRYSNGNFIIFDVDSLNGVYVNDEKIKKKKLEEGDIIEIGDIFLRFTLYSADYQAEEDTAVQRTRTPSIN